MSGTNVVYDPSTGNMFANQLDMIKSKISGSKITPIYSRNGMAGNQGNNTTYNTNPAVNFTQNPFITQQMAGITANGGGALPAVPSSVMDAFNSKMANMQGKK
jgi:hypothetical protein